jgi:hypothetical protein
MPDYLAPFLQQLSHGTQVIQQLKQQALQQDQMKFERQQVERQNEMQDRQMQNADIGNLQRLRETARDVPASGSYDAPSLAQQFDPITGNVTGSTPMRGKIAVDPSKVVNYRTADGKTRAFELMSSDEIANRQLERLRATKGVENTAALEQMRQKLGMETDAEVEKAKRLSPLKQQEAGIIAEAQAEGRGKGEQKAYLLGKQYTLPEAVATFHGFDPAEKFTAKERQDLVTEHSKVTKQQLHDQQQAQIQLQKMQEDSRHNRAMEGAAAGHLAIARNAYEQTYGAGANPALAGVEPKLRTQAMTQAQRASTEHIGALAAADEMQQMVNEMRKGNKVAYAYAPTTGVLTINTASGVKRVNMAEIKQYEGAGSIVDSIVGHIGKATSGASLSPSLVNDIESLHRTLADGATRKYNAQVSAINQNYRSNFKPVETKAMGGAMVRMKAPNGQVSEVPADQAEHFMKLGAQRVQ